MIRDRACRNCGGTDLTFARRGLPAGEAVRTAIFGVFVGLLVVGGGGLLALRLTTPFGRSPNVVLGVVLLAVLGAVEVAVEVRRSPSRAGVLWRCQRCGQRTRLPSGAVVGGEASTTSAARLSAPGPPAAQFTPSSVAPVAPRRVAIEHPRTRTPLPTLGAEVLSRLRTEDRRRFEAPCPRCGSFDTETTRRSDPTTLDFRCQACDHHWRWTDGSPWPDATSGGASSALRRVSVHRHTVVNER